MSNRNPDSLGDAESVYHDHIGELSSCGLIDQETAAAINLMGSRRDISAAAADGGRDGDAAPSNGGDRR